MLLEHLFLRTSFTSFKVKENVEDNYKALKL